MPVAVSNQHTVCRTGTTMERNEFMIATVPDIDTAALDLEERMSADETEALQLSRLRHALQYAYYRVPHHNKKFDAHGVHPSDLNDLADLGQVFFYDQDDLRETYPAGMFAVPMIQVSRIQTSPGTIGGPTVGGCTRTGRLHMPDRRSGTRCTYPIQWKAASNL